MKFKFLAILNPSMVPTLIITLTELFGEPVHEPYPTLLDILFMYVVPSILMMSERPLLITCFRGGETQETCLDNLSRTCT